MITDDDNLHDDTPAFCLFRIYSRNSPGEAGKSARVGQATTQANSSRSGHISHLIVYSPPGLTASKGQTITHIQHPTHLSVSHLTSPSSLIMAPAIQASTQGEGSHWRQATVRQEPSTRLTFLLGTGL